MAQGEPCYGAIAFCRRAEHLAQHNYAVTDKTPSVLGVDLYAAPAQDHR